LPSVLHDLISGYITGNQGHASWMLKLGTKFRFESIVASRSALTICGSPCLSTAGTRSLIRRAGTTKGSNRRPLPFGRFPAIRPTFAARLNKGCRGDDLPTSSHPAK
jgi:hypothetical protein